MTYVGQQIPPSLLNQGGDEHVAAVWAGNLESGHFVTTAQKLTAEQQAANLAIVEARILDVPGTGNPNICDTGPRQREATFFGQI